MPYDFETLIPRFGRGSFKWDQMQKMVPHLFTNPAAFPVEKGESDSSHPRRRLAPPAAPDCIIPFSVADMEFPLAPEIAAGLKRFIDTVPLGYANPPEAWFEAVRGWIHTRHHWTIERAWIQDVCGVVDAFDAAIRAFTRKGDGILLMTPVYYPMFRAAEAHGRALVETRLLITESGSGLRCEIDFDDLAEKARHAKALLFCSPHNPVGRVWTRQELELVAEICLENGLAIISDDIHCDLVMPGHQHTMIATLAPEVAAITATLVSASKTFNLAGLRTASAIIPNAKRRRAFTSAIQVAGFTPQCSILGYEAARIAYTEAAPWLDAALEVIADNARLVARRIARELPAIKLFDMEGTYLLWLDFRAFGLDDYELERRNQEEGALFFDEGRIFGDAGRGFERWNLACPRRFIAAGLDRLCKVYQGLV
ncbi:MAG: PatB family C-S lyase [Treponema sp.]|jgi:putative C-S lyase|nr:PatB family C-S lyase [Treponema sp.]